MIDNKRNDSPKGSQNGNKAKKVKEKILRAENSLPK